MFEMYELTRLVAWIGIGCSLALLAWIIGWKSLLKAAPYLFFGWLGLAVWATAWPQFPEWRGWLKFGVPFNILEFAPMAVGLMGAWIAQKTGAKMMRVLGVMVMVLLAAEVVTIACSEERQERIRRSCEDSAVEREAFERYKEQRETVRGRPYYNAMCVGIGLLGLGLVLLIRRGEDEPAKVYVTVIGLSIGGRAIGSVLGGIGITPMVEIVVPFLSGGGSLIVATLLSLGVACASSRSQRPKAGET